MVLESKWRKWFSWYPVQVIGGDWVFLRIIERRFCEDHGGEFTEYRKVPQQTVEKNKTIEEPTGETPYVAVKNYPDGFYWIYTEKDGQKSNVCLVRLYADNVSQQKGIGFGMWDGAGFMPLTDICKNMHLVPAEFNEKNKEYNELIEEQEYIKFTNKKELGVLI